METLRGHPNLPPGNMSRLGMDEEQLDIEVLVNFYRALPTISLLWFQSVPRAYEHSVGQGRSKVNEELCLMAFGFPL